MNWSWCELIGGPFDGGRIPVPRYSMDLLLVHPIEEDEEDEDKLLSFDVHVYKRQSANSDRFAYLGKKERVSTMSDLRSWIEEQNG